MQDIPRWKVQAALKLLGIEATEQTYAVEIRLSTNQIAIFGQEMEYVHVTDAIGDTRLHVLGIDPENGKAELRPVPDGDVQYYTGAGMYLAGGAKHANGTLMPVFKKAVPE